MPVVAYTILLLLLLLGKSTIFLYNFSIILVVGKINLVLSSFTTKTTATLF
jgi:hypothetical protein